MDDIRGAEAVPEEAVSFAVSLDGVALRSDGHEEACWREASCGTVSFHDVDGNRLNTLYWMPEAGKATLKAQIGVTHIRKVRSDLPLIAVVDAAADNWTFLERLRPDEQAVDFFHACEYLSKVSDQRPTGTTSTALSCVTTSTASTGPALKVLDREIGFFRKHKRRMRYASLKGHVIGSGVPLTGYWSINA